MVRTDLPLSSNINREVLEAIRYMRFRNSDETPEMWCDRIRAPFKKILEENPSFFSKNEYIRMYGWHYEDGKRVTSTLPVFSNYIYCTACDSLVYIPNNMRDHRCASDHLKRCIAGDTGYCSVSGECAIVNTDNEWRIWLLKQKILRYEAEIRRNQLELSPQFQSLSHSEKDKSASMSYVINDISYETFRASMAGLAQPDYTTMAGLSSAQHDYTNLGTLSVYFKSMQKGANL